MNALWDLYQQYQIHELQGRVSAAGSSASAAERSARTIPDIDERIARLALLCRAMFELMQEVAPGVTEEKLSAKVIEIDLRDGQEDGRMMPKAKRCPKCEAMMSPKFGRCLFCGEKDGNNAVRFS